MASTEKYVTGHLDLRGRQPIPGSATALVTKLPDGRDLSRTPKGVKAPGISEGRGLTDSPENSHPPTGSYTQEVKSHHTIGQPVAPQNQPPQSTIESTPSACDRRCAAHTNSKRRYLDEKPSSNAAVREIAPNPSSPRRMAAKPIPPESALPASIILKKGAGSEIPGYTSRAIRVTVLVQRSVAIERPATVADGTHPRSSN